MKKNKNKTSEAQMRSTVAYRERKKSQGYIIYYRMVLPEEAAELDELLETIRMDKNQ